MNKFKRFVSFSVFSLAGNQLLSRSRGSRRDYTWPNRAHNAATYFPPGAGSWGKVSHQVSSLKISTQLIFRIGVTEERKGAVKCWKMNRRGVRMGRQFACWSHKTCMRSMLIQWHEKEGGGLIRSAGARLITPFFFVIANSSLKITIWPWTLRCTAAR